MDIRVTGEASNSISSITAFENADVTVTPSTDVQVALLAGATKTISGTVSVTVPNTANCGKVSYLCANSLPTANAYPESLTRRINNWRCKDISAQVSCAIGEILASLMVSKM